MKTTSPSRAVLILREPPDRKNKVLVTGSSPLILPQVQGADLGVLCRRIGGTATVETTGFGECLQAACAQALVCA